MTRLLHWLGGLLAIVVIAFASAAAEPVHIAVPTSICFGPLYVAREKGFFSKHGVEVELTTSNEAKQHYPLLLAGKYDMLAGAVGTSVLYIKGADDVQYVTTLSDSNGADGIIARSEIATLADLKGKSVGVSLASMSEFYLNVLLRQAGLSEEDLALVDMSPREAGEAFMAKRLDAAVTWEPFLSEAKRTDFAHLLSDSTTAPGLLADALIVRKEFVRDHPTEVKAVVAAWNDAVAFVETHPDEATEIIARGLGGRLKNMTNDALEKVRLYGGDDSRIMFGTAQRPGPLYATLKQAIDIWRSLGRVSAKVTPEDIMNYRFVAE